MALVQINVVDPQSLQRCIQLLLDLPSRQTAVGVTHWKEQLGSQHIAFAFDASQCLAKNRLGRTLAIDVRRIQEIDADIERAMDTRDSDLLALWLRECQPRTEANLRNQELTISQFPIFHMANAVRICRAARTPASCMPALCYM